MAKTAPNTAVVQPTQSNSVDPNILMSTIGQIEEISRRYARNKARDRRNSPFQLPKFPKAALPDAKMAMDSDAALTANLSYGTDAWLSGEVINGMPGESLLFLGYAYLSELAQRPEYRVMAETIADDATRKWIDFDVVGDERMERKKRAKDPQGYDEMMADPDERKKRVDKAGKLDKVKALQDDQLRLAVKDHIYEQCRNDGFFGRSHVYLDIHTNGRPDDAELKTPIGDGRDSISKSKVPKGSFKRMQTVEPMWSYPLGYNASDPLLESWYNPEVWYVMGRELHGSRLLTFIGHPVPDMLKPAYGFGGLSLTQMAKPYVDIWLQTRQSVADLIHSFSVMCLMTDLSTLMQPGNVGALLTRAAMFNMLRDNNGLFVVNKSTEDFKNVSASLSGLHELQAQAQEHMACLVAGTLIETDIGQVPIEKVTTNHMVMTRNGLAPVRWSGQTGVVSELIEIQTSNSVLRATGWHPIWSETTNQFVDASDVDRSHRLLESKEWGNTVRRSHGEGIGGRKGRTGTIFPATAASCIAAFTRLMSGLFQTVATFITETVTSPIMHSQILSHLVQQITSSDNSITAKYHALFAGLPSKRHGQNEPSIAPTLVSCMRERLTEGGFRTENTPNAANVVDRILPASGRAALNFALNPARAVPITHVDEISVSSQPVYNLEVADGFLPEFFANGILVHNSVHRIPLVKFTGIQPSGLNASSEGEIKTYDDTIMAYQSRFIAPNLTKIINFQQLSLFGEIDPEITFHFEPLRELTQAEKGQKQKDDADRDQKYVDMGALHPGEVRKIIVNDKDLPFTGLDPDDVPDLLSEENMGLEPEGGRPQDREEPGDKEVRDAIDGQG